MSKSELDLCTGASEPFELIPNAKYFVYNLIIYLHIFNFVNNRMLSSLTSCCVEILIGGRLTLFLLVR